MSRLVSVTYTVLQFNNSLGIKRTGRSICTYFTPLLMGAASGVTAYVLMSFGEHIAIALGAP